MSNINIDSIKNNSSDTKSNPFQENSDSLNLQKNFLNLLITQIKNQDPTDPIKNSELTSQLAQINTASGVERLNKAVEHVSNKMNQNQNIQISSLINHHVMIPNSQVIHTENINTPFGIELFGNADSVTIQIKDENNTVLHTKTIQNLTPGTYKFIWNGKNLDNVNVNTGKYNITVTAIKSNKYIPVQVLSPALVNSVITSSDDPILDLGIMGTVTLSKVRAILE